ncbi:hypothetical protein [Agromyces subbeticus]|uniref:hypothetical protein n=1 Tax=Agromyces subbeticus TaxID=293890 RepID=UPI0003B3B6E7|nr:hypothetical protein [Agromyces subbeticus]
MPETDDLAGTEDAWYQQLRKQWKPNPVRLLLVAESAPAPGAAAADRRFFYAPTVSRHDNLFRAVVIALYGQRVLTGDDRAELLGRLRSDGVWLIDLSPFPVNHLSPGRRQRTLVEHAPARVRDIESLTPDGVVICHTLTYRALAPGLTAAGAPLLHERPIPFPLGNFQAAFVVSFRTAVAPLGLGPDITVA